MRNYTDFRSSERFIELLSQQREYGLNTEERLELKEMCEKQIKKINEELSTSKNNAYECEVVEKYGSLVAMRQGCNLCEGLKNPTEVEPEYDVDEIGAWSDWKGDLDAKIVIVGQDWGDINSYIESEGKCDPQNETNRNLVHLLESIGLSVNDDKLFFTNALLCLKTGGLSAKVKTKWLNNCGAKFLRPLLDLIKPEITITLGVNAYNTLTSAYNEKPMRFSEAVNQESPHILHSQNYSLKLFPVYHCGKLGLVNRKRELQLKDWKRIQKFL